MKHPALALSFIFAAFAAPAISLFHSTDADACSRVVYHGSDSLYVVGRSLDWKTPIPTNIYVYPRGMEKGAPTSTIRLNGAPNMPRSMLSAMTAE